MTKYNPYLVAVASVLSLQLEACGGGGGGQIASIPPPEQTPTPTPTPPSSTSDVPAGAYTDFTIINQPSTGNLAVAGASASGALADPAMLADASLAAADQPQMRYDAATNTYQVQLPGGSWGTLWTRVDAPHPDTAAIGSTGSIIGFNLYPDGDVSPYSYSALAWDSGPIGQRYGTLAVGVPTDASALPTGGSAQYDGIISGETDIFELDPASGYDFARGVSGSVTLSFDFATGSLSGSMEPQLSLTESLGVFTFKNAVYSAGSYSGQFNSSVAGTNGFYGQLVGPNGEELIGGWALPFHYSGDDQDHEAIGAWIAKQTP